MEDTKRQSLVAALLKYNAAAPRYTGHGSGDYGPRLPGQYYYDRYGRPYVNPRYGFGNGYRNYGSRPYPGYERYDGYYGTGYRGYVDPRVRAGANIGGAIGGAIDGDRGANVGAAIGGALGAGRR